MHIVYVLKSEKDGNPYIGCTSDINKRIEYHSNGKVFFTKHRRPRKELKIISVAAGSSNGRTIAFGAIYLGSNPSPAATDGIFNSRGRPSAVAR